MAKLVIITEYEGEPGWDVSSIATWIDGLDGFDNTCVWEMDEFLQDLEDYTLGDTSVTNEFFDHVFSL